ncbi:pyridoxamine 5'-phosphate oxidase family protein [Paenarthrobacter sp. S56]|uniref:pyridoxamine 5'-phosphate oxidase family protein n=1 Tax=Paenarthrobacter sp. S56 TaxID=3138179 RepID=UPI00321BAF8E
MSDKNIVPEPQVLEADDCWRLLAETSIGRLSVIANGHPDIFPINFAVHNKSLVFRTGIGTKQQAMEQDAVVAVEADAVSAEFGLAWSVVVKGPVQEATPDSPALNDVRRALFPWQGLGQDLLYMVVPSSVTGRRFDLTAAHSLRTPLDDATRAGLD